MKILNIISTILLMQVSSFSLAAVLTCEVKIRNVIVHENGNYYFTADKVCQGAWCNIEWKDSSGNLRQSAMDRGFDLLVKAKENRKRIKMTFPGIESCDINEAHTPSSIQFIDL